MDTTKDLFRRHGGELATTAIGVTLTLMAGLWWGLSYSPLGFSLTRGWSKMAGKLGLSWSLLGFIVGAVVAVVVLRLLLKYAKRFVTNSEWALALIIVVALVIGGVAFPFIGSVAGTVVSNIGRLVIFVVIIAALTAIAFGIRRGATRLLKVFK